ncbi:MAG: SIMPL domain-containing protein [Bacillota bacterium]
MNGRTVRVQGRAVVAAEPDLAILNFELEARDYDYERSSLELNRRVELLRGELEKAGVERKALKTTNFKIDTDYEWQNSKRIFKGYKASHDLILELPFEREVLNRVVRTVAESASEAEMRISFGVKDEEKLRRTALAKSVAVARRNAEVLAEAAGVSLGEIIDIEYGWTEVRLRSSFQLNADMVCEAASGPDFEPTEVEAEESVSVVWEIKSVER